MLTLRLDQPIGYFHGMIQLDTIRRVDAAAAFAELAAHRIIFIGDSQHNCPHVRGGILRAMVQMLPDAPHRDVCLEGALEGFTRLQEIAQAYNFPSPQFTLENCVDRTEALFISNKREISELFGLCVMGVGRLLGGRVHAVDLKKTALRPLVRKFRKCMTEPNTDVALARLALLQQKRLSMDPEIAANIWYAARQRPACVVFGADHLNPSGLPTHFAPGEAAALIVFRDTDHMKSEIAQAAQNCPQLHPGYHPCVSHAYLATEKIWLKVRTPHAG